MLFFVPLRSTPSVSKGSQEAAHLHTSNTRLSTFHSGFGSRTLNTIQFPQRVAQCRRGNLCAVRLITRTLSTNDLQGRLPSAGHISFSAAPLRLPPSACVDVAKTFHRDLELLQPHHLSRRHALAGCGFLFVLELLGCPDGRQDHRLCETGRYLTLCVRIYLATCGAVIR